MALISLISAEIDKAKNDSDFSSLKDWLEIGNYVIKKFEEEKREENFITEGDSLSLSPESYENKFTPEAAASILNSSIVFCNVIISGSEAAIGLKYDEENMFAPMIVFLEKFESAAALVWAGENLGVPIVKNDLLAKNLLSYGKAGASVPEACYRDVSLALARSSLAGQKRLHRNSKRARLSGTVKITSPLYVEMGERLYTLSGEEPGRKILLITHLDALRLKLENLLGIKMPQFRIIKNQELDPDTYIIFFKGLEAGRGRLELSWYSGLQQMIVRNENLKTAAKSAMSIIIKHVKDVINLRSPELLGRDEVDAILEAAEEKYPIVCSEARSLVSLGMIRDILQNLVSEQVSIKPIAVILETIADWSSFGPAPIETIIEQIRLSLKRQICLDYANERLVLKVLTINADMEKLFLDYSLGISSDASEETEGTGGIDDCVNTISLEADKMKEMGYPPVILCTPRIRFILRECTRKKIPSLAVLSYLEILKDIKVEPVNEIKLNGNLNA